MKIIKISFRTIVISRKEPVDIEIILWGEDNEILVAKFSPKLFTESRVKSTIRIEKGKKFNFNAGPLEVPQGKELKKLSNRDAYLIPFVASYIIRKGFDIRFMIMNFLTGQCEVEKFQIDDESYEKIFA